MILRLVILFFLFVAPFQNSYAQRGGQTIIRDTEIEATLKEWMDPLLKAGGLDSSSVNIILVQDSQLNAFVAGGANIFLYTGLIEKTETPGELIGVMAHELGHIVGGHLISTRNAMERASYESLLGILIGVGAAVGSGDPTAAGAVITGSTNVAQRRLLAHSRINESSADQAAFRLMENAEINPDGMVSFFRTLENQELLPPDQQSEYIRTHPLTRNRVETAEVKASQSPYQGKAYPESWNEGHARMKAKLMGFINPGRVLWTYNDNDQSIPARYARAIAAYRNHDQAKAMHEIDELIGLEPENPYFHELKGQMLVDFGKVSESLKHYERALELDPDAALIRIAYAHALLESGYNDAAKQEKAIKNLERALLEEPRSTRVRRLLATAHGRLGQEALTKVYLAEEALLQRNFTYARGQAKAALELAPAGSREHIRAQDLLKDIDIADRE